jgi:hypothetical protein
MPAFVARNVAMIVEGSVASAWTGGTPKELLHGVVELLSDCSNSLRP